MIILAAFIIIIIIITVLTDATKLKGKSKTSKKKQEVTEMNGDIQNGFATFTAGEVSERPYEPNSFADTHLSDLLMENEHLKMKVSCCF